MACIYLSSLALKQKINLCKQDTDACVHIVIFFRVGMFAILKWWGP